MAAEASHVIWDNRGQPGGVCTIEVTWQSDASGDCTEVIDTLLSGRIMALITDPDGTSVPSADYDVTLVSGKIPSYDLLHGFGVNRSDTDIEEVQIMDEVTIGSNTYADHPHINEARATFTVAGAGDTKKGKAWIIIE